MQLFTIGYGGKSLQEFVGQLRSHDIGTVVDIRLRPSGQLSGYARQRDLRYLLEGLLDVRYVHEPAFCPTPQLLDAYKGTGDSAAFDRGFLALLKERDPLGPAKELLSLPRPCLLCAEAAPEQCHRRLAAQWIAANLPAVEVVHAGAPATTHSHGAAAANPRQSRLGR